MDINSALPALSALAQATRLEAFRTLLRHEPGGVSAGELARMLDIPQNTLSTHLSILAHASLVFGERQQRSIIYRADLQKFRELLQFLSKDCCDGRPDICALLLDEPKICATCEEPRS